MRTITMLTLMVLFVTGMISAVDPVSKQPTVNFEDFQKMTGDQTLEKVRKIDYSKMTDKEYIAIYQNISAKLASLDIKKDVIECSKVYVAILNLGNSYDTRSSKLLTRAGQDALANSMSKELNNITPEAWASAMQQLQGTDEQLQKKLTDARAAKEKQKNQALENDAKFIISQAKDFPSDDYSAGIAKLNELKKKAPASQVIADGLTLLEKMKSNFRRIEIKALEITSTPVSKKCQIQIANKSGLKARSFGIIVWFMDAKGKVLKKEENQSSSENLEPSSADGCAPGYVGTTWISLNDETLVEKWEKTAVQLKFVRFDLEQQ